MTLSSLFVDLRLFITLAAMFFLPGSAILVLSRAWTRWRGLQAYIVAVGLSVAFYPVLFYAARFVLPAAALGPWVMGGLLFLAAVVTIWGCRKYGAFSLKLDRLEWTAVFLLALTFASRFWLVYTHPYPAWSDSLHHTLLTQLTAVNGRLPTTLEPYFPNTLEMYHLGLYAISGTASMVAHVPAHTALVWTAQFLNSLCGIGIYLALDRYAGRTGALAGLAVAGLFSAHPALWANWGRFTQLASQVLFPIAWVLTLDVLGVLPQKQDETVPVRPTFWSIFFVSLMTAAVFLLHFRVAAFYGLLLGVTAVVALLRVSSWPQRWAILKVLTLIGALSLLIIFPALWAAGSKYLANHQATAVQATAAQQDQLRQNYYEFPLDTIPYLAAPVWLLIISGAAALVGLFRRNLLVVINLVWLVLLVILGNLYLLNIPVLNVTNFGAILIMIYLPLSLIIGAGVEEGLALVPTAYQQTVVTVLVIVLLVASVPAARARATTVEEYRHFITAADVAAMTWIKANVPPEATFAINTYFWLPAFAHGTDAGYWLPYFTGNHIVTSSMLFDGSSREYRQRVLAQSEAAEALETDLGAVAELYDLGVDYIYIGARGDFSGPGLQRDFLTQSDRIELVYEKEGTAVLHILPPAN